VIAGLFNQANRQRQLAFETAARSLQNGGKPTIFEAARAALKRLRHAKKDMLRLRTQVSRPMTILT